MRMAVGLTLLSTTAVDFLSADMGFGVLIYNAWQILSLTDCLVGMLVAGILGASAFTAIYLVESVAFQSRSSPTEARISWLVGYSKFSLSGFYRLSGSLQNP